jgi:2-oxoglutarate dehydrogenase E1 component
MSPDVRGGLEARTMAEFDAAQEQARRMERRPPLLRPSPRWAGYHGGPYRRELEVGTAVEPRTLAALAERIASAPEGFALHPKVAKGLEARRKMGRGELPVDWGMAEALAFGSLLRQRIPVRLSGQDSRRGTFNQRHSVLFDVNTGAEHVPLAHLGGEQAPFETWDSPLSEAGVLGFDYGWSLEAPDALVCWEAQFGDFANGAQVVIDQFLAAGEDKWGLLSGLTLLLPHGYEGQGPEHSSARLERFLQLAAEDQMQIVQPTTAAQYFHLLRRQALRKWRKPLVVMTPKSLLRNPAAASPLAALAGGRWQPVLGDESVAAARQVLVGTGKVVHELRAERERRRDAGTAIVALEQLFPFPDVELGEALDRHGEARRIAWIQEEPANMGALAFVLRRLEPLAGGRFVTSVKRAASASPATGSRKAHQIEQETLYALAFGPDPPGAAPPAEAAGDESALA